MKCICILILVVVTAHLRAQILYSNDRVYTANQVSNTVSVVDPSQNKLLGEIKLGKPFPDVLNPLYRGQALVHGLRYSPKRKMLAVVSIGSNSVTLISTENNQILKIIYVGRSPHEPTFTPDEKQMWISIRGEGYISVVDVSKMIEIRRISVADGPGMVAFSKDGKEAYVCSSFTPELDIVSTATYEVIKRIPVVSPFSPNIFTSPDGKWIALTHKDVGKVTVINTETKAIEKVIGTGPITNHVTFAIPDKRLLMLTTVGGENKVRVFDVADNFRQIDSINTGALPHGIWSSGDGKQLFVGLEYADAVARIDLQAMALKNTIHVGQSPQALVYADNAVTDLSSGKNGLSALNDSSTTQVVVLNNTPTYNSAHGRLAIRPIGLAELVEQAFSGLKPNTAYTVALSKSASAPFEPGFAINAFNSDGQGKYLGQSTGIINNMDKTFAKDVYKTIIVIEDESKVVILAGTPITK